MKKYFILIILISATEWSFAQYRHDSIKVEHGYLHYYMEGEGKPIVHLQGGPGFSSYYLRGLVDSLPGYQNILIDYQGTGRSQYRRADRDWVSIENIINDVELVREKLNISNWTIVGHSFGSTFALHYAVTFPQHVHKLISIGGNGTDNSLVMYLDDNLHIKFTEAEMQQDRNLNEDTSRTSQDKFLESMALHIPGYFYDRKKGYAFLASFPSEETGRLMNSDFAEAYWSDPDLMKYDIGKEVYALEIPIRIINGRQDLVGERIAVLLNERSKNSRLYFVERAGHFPWIEQPQDFFQKLNEFLID